MNTRNLHDDDATVELGEEVEAAPRRKGSPMVAVRVPPELLEAVSGYAEQTGMTISEVFRSAVERLVRGSFAGPTFVSGTLVVMAGGTIVQGSPSSGIGRSRRESTPNPDFVGTISE
jgi:hypothetical protein